MSSNEFDIPEEINVHRQIWGKDAAEVIYGRGEIAEDTMTIDALFVFHELMNLDIVLAAAI
jgi:hypothetical protein